MSRVAYLLAGVAIGTVVVVSAQAAKPVIMTVGDLKWIGKPEMKGATQAILWGDPTKGAFGALKKIPAGTILPWHYHTNATREVIVTGTVILEVEGQQPKELAPQAYSMLPGGAKHTATCKAGGPDCVYFETSTGMYDLKEVPR
jgi:quercetin dioxygenase-like cupin family protein